MRLIQCSRRDFSFVRVLRHASEKGYGIVLVRLYPGDPSTLQAIPKPVSR